MYCGGLVPAGLLGTSSFGCATVLFIESMHAVARSSALLDEQGSQAGPKYGRDFRPSALLIIRLGKVELHTVILTPEYTVVHLDDGENGCICRFWRGATDAVNGMHFPVKNVLQALVPPTEALDNSSRMNEKERERERGIVTTIKAQAVRPSAPVPPPTQSMSIRGTAVGVGVARANIVMS
jgi:hypothetical protein